MRLLLPRSFFQILLFHYILFFTLNINAQTLPSQPQNIVSQAITLYTQAQNEKDYAMRLNYFSQAENLFSLAAQTIHNPKLYTNWGNAALQAEHLGIAIYAYRKALLLAPNHLQAQKNLLHARSLLPTWVPHKTQQNIIHSFIFWEKLSNNEKHWLAALSFFVCLLCIAISIRWQLTVFKGLTILPAILFMAIQFSILTKFLFPPPQQAVIYQNESIAYTSDSINAPHSFSQPLPDGIEVSILEERDQWVHVEFTNQQDAWLKKVALKIL